MLPSKNMKRNLQDQKLDFRREEKYRSANQATLQMKLDEFRIIVFYSYNNIAVTSPSNLFISKKVSQLNSVTRRSWNCGKRILMSNLGQHPITKIPIPSMPTLKQHLAAIQF